MKCSGLALLGLLCGCHKLFSLDRVELSVDARGPDAAIDAAIKCPGDYDITLPSAPSSRYKRIASFEGWDNAVLNCSYHAPGRTHLVVISTDAERYEASQIMPANSLWIGLSDRQNEGTFRWITQETAPVPVPNQPPWGAGQPDSQTDAQDCVRIEGSTGGSPTFYDDAECASGFAYLCECDDWANEPTRY